MLNPSSRHTHSHRHRRRLLQLPLVYRRKRRILSLDLNLTSRHHHCDWEKEEEKLKCCESVESEFWASFERISTPSILKIDREAAEKFSSSFAFRTRVCDNNTREKPSRFYLWKCLALQTRRDPVGWVRACRFRLGDRQIWSVVVRGGSDLRVLAVGWRVQMGVSVPPPLKIPARPLFCRRPSRFLGGRPRWAAWAETRHPPPRSLQGDLRRTGIGSRIKSRSWSASRVVAGEVDSWPRIQSLDFKPPRQSYTTSLISQIERMKEKQFVFILHTHKVKRDEEILWKCAKKMSNPLVEPRQYF